MSGNLVEIQLFIKMPLDMLDERIDQRWLLCIKASASALGNSPHNVGDDEDCVGGDDLIVALLLVDGFVYSVCEVIANISVGAALGVKEYWRSHSFNAKAGEELDDFCHKACVNPHNISVIGVLHVLGKDWHMAHSGGDYDDVACVYSVLARADQVFYSVCGAAMYHLVEGMGVKGDIHLFVSSILVNVRVGGGHLQLLVEVCYVDSILADIFHDLFDLFSRLWLLEFCL